MSTVILLEDEPLESVLGTWLGWMTTMVLFAVILIYVSDYFARSNECFIVDEYNTGHPVQDLKNQAWRKRFEQVDKTYGREGLVVTKPYENTVQVIGYPESGSDLWDFLDAKGVVSNTPRRKPDLSHDRYYLSGTYVSH